YLRVQLLCCAHVLHSIPTRRSSDLVGGTLGDAERADYVIDQLEQMKFVSGGTPEANAGRFQLAGNLTEVIGQVVGFQGSTISAADRKSTRLNSSHVNISYAVFCSKK